MRGHLCLLLVLLFNATTLRAETVTVACASNFVRTLEQLRVQFERQSRHQLTLVGASSGKLYAQIVNGAPFDVLLAADAETPARLRERDLAVANSQFTYATGRLVLWRARAGPPFDGIAILRTDAGPLALANPAHAPYGRAAQQTLQALDLWDQWRQRMVYAENVNQAVQFVASGNASLGWVARAQVLALAPEQRGAWWEVPRDLYAPIVQDAVLLQHGRNNSAARKFVAFLRSEIARTLIRQAGYD